ncbi:MAG: hypothetical protein HYZ17_12960 [Betaproteobacteria bacterium]|nr:hypothetical protein [Betaproteobacteria bacterium]
MQQQTLNQWRQSCLPPPPPLQKANRALTILCVLALATSTVAAQVEGQIDYRATAQAPVHLMRNSNGAAFTAVLDQHPVSGELRLKKRPVTPPEIARLEAQGVTLAYLRDPDEAQPPEATWSSEPYKVGSPAPWVPRNFTIMKFYGSLYGGFWTTANFPNGASTHWSNFDLTSTGYSATAEHIAHSLFFDGAAVSSPKPALIGNGLAIGKLAGYPGPWHVGCGAVDDPGYYAEVEAFWRDDNALYPDSCSETGDLNDGQTNNFTLHANTNQWVAYWIARNGQTFFTAPGVNTSAQRPTFDPTKGGVLFTVMGLPGPDFTLSFRNVFTGWF